MVSFNSSVNSYVLSNLRQINSDLNTAQTRIGTGKKINSSSDNASVWATAQSIRSDQKAQDGLASGISVAKARADTAVAALDTVVGLLGQIQTLSEEAANTTPSSYDSVNNKITALKAQITATVSGASFEGQNWLTTAAAAGGTVTTGVSGGSSQTTSVTTLNLNVATTGAMTIFNAITSTLSSAGTSSTLATGAETAVAALSAYQASLSTFSGILSSTQDLQNAFSGIRSTALSNLVDADLTEESAKVTALQTQQQLAYQALAITNSSASNILALFR